jgi:hypothetical protein
VLDAAPSVLTGFARRSFVWESPPFRCSGRYGWSCFCLWWVGGNFFCLQGMPGVCPPVVGRVGRASVSSPCVEAHPHCFRLLLFPYFACTGCLSRGVRCFRRIPPCVEVHSTCFPVRGKGPRHGRRRYRSLARCSQQVAAGSGGSAPGRVNCVSLSSYITI